mmetsp:Transcript_17503/g.24068  ORF Transcript_17503/g.24068 Transcript_17503/m.24068 type:complete len:740 (-) Transcript_17503:92-2311(-)
MYFNALLPLELMLCVGHLIFCSGLGMKLTIWSTARFRMRTLMSPKDENGYVEDIEKQIIKKETPYIGEEMSEWDGYMDGFDWQLERARRLLEGPAFAPMRMTLWQPSVGVVSKQRPPGFFDQSKILLNNAFQMAGITESMDGAPMVQGVNTFKGDIFNFLARVADGNLAELAGGPLFLLLQNYYERYGSVFKLAFGPKSFIVVSDPVMVKYILKENPLNYDKGILAEILEPVMGKGLIPADPETWKVRRKAIVPGFHKAWLNAMINLFANCNQPLVDKLTRCSEDNTELNMETEFCSVSLDIIGRAVFNYKFGSVDKESPVVKAVYRALQEAEHRSTSFIPYWQVPFAKHFMKNLQEFEENMLLLNTVLDELIVKALETQQKQDVAELENRDYTSMENASLLRFLVDMRGEDTTSKQLRDDLMTMLIAGHETTAALLTWTMFELSQQPELYERVQSEIDGVLSGRNPTYDDILNLPLLRLCLAETLRMYPQPPLLIRRALDDDILPQGFAKNKTFIPRGTDIFISTWNMHRSPDYWDEPNKYRPERFLSSFNNTKNPHSEWAGFRPSTPKQLYPNEVNSDFAFIPFGGGSRKCVGDQFAMMESVITIALIMQRFDLSLSIPPEDVGMKTGATIHTANGLMMRVKKRQFNHNVSSVDNINHNIDNQMRMAHDTISTTSSCPMHDMKLHPSSEDHSSSHINKNPSSIQADCPFGAIEATTTTTSTASTTHQNNHSKVQLVK